jgi:Penicillin-binding Protein dimerisation domain
MKRINTLLICLIVGYVGMVLYANRAFYFSKFDAVYWKDKYEHSQWKLPLSQRTLGDDGLYLYEGYRLVHGENPTTLNAEVPPLGKYAIGTSIIVFGNGYVYGYIMTLFAVVAFSVFAYVVTSSFSIAIITGALLITDPLITEQFALTMLDSQHLLFLSLYLLSLAGIIKTKSHIVRLLSILAAGTSLGLFAETKFPILAPMLAIIGILMIWKQKKKNDFIAIFLASGVIAYLIPYIPYFIQGHSLIEWLKVQKWILSFYMASGLKPTVGSMFTTLLFNQNQNLYSHLYETVNEWSPLWPFITISGIVGGFRVFRRYMPFIIITGFLLLFFAITPFWTRYLVIILPLLYLGSVLFLDNNKRSVFRFLPYILIGINVAFSLFILFPTPKQVTEQFLWDWRHGFFQDVYEATDRQTKQMMDRNSFYRFGQQTLYDAQIEDAEIAVEPYIWHPLRSPQYIPLRITYKTKNLGTFEEHQTIPVYNENGIWRVSWKWNYLMSGLSPTFTVETVVKPAKRGGLFAKNGVPLSYDEESVLIWLLPERISKDTKDEVFTSLETLFEKRVLAVQFHERYVRLGSLGKPIPLGVLMRPMDLPTEAILKQFPALTTTKAYGRFIVYNSAYDIGTVTNTLFSECCSLLYNTTAYDGKDGLEKIYNATLKGENGGTLVVKDKDGRVVRTIIEKIKRDGGNVQL